MSVTESKISKGPWFGIRHLQALLLFINIVVVYVSRLNIAVAVVAMTNANSTNPNFPEYDWSEKQKSYILSSFYWGYVITQFPGGYLSRRFGVKITMLTSTFCTAIFSLATPFLIPWGGWQIYCVIRIFQGLFQGLLFPAIHEHLGKWSPPHERNLLGALSHSGVDCGTVMAMGVSGMIAGSPLGWPGISYISAGLCFGWCVLWFIFGANNAPDSRFCTPEECNYIESSMARQENFHKQKIPIPWAAIFSSAPFLGLLTARCAEAWGFSTIQAEIPSYLNGVLNMDIKSNALYSALPYLTMWFLSYVYLFFASMTMSKKWATLTVMRKTINTIALWVPAALMIGIGFLDEQQKTWALVLMTANVGVNGGATIGSTLNTIDLSSNHAGILMGIVNTIANIVPIITPLLVGIIVTDVSERSQWQIVFAIAAVVFFFGNLVYIIWGSAETQPWNEVDFMKLRDSEIPDDAVLETKEKNKKNGLEAIESKYLGNGTTAAVDENFAETVLDDTDKVSTNTLALEEGEENTEQPRNQTEKDEGTTDLVKSKIPAPDNEKLDKNNGKLEQKDAKSENNVGKPESDNRNSDINAIEEIRSISTDEKEENVQSTEATEPPINTVTNKDKD